MNTYKKFRDILHTDRTLMVLLGGIIISWTGIIGVVIAAGLWFL